MKRRCITIILTSVICILLIYNVISVSASTEQNNNEVKTETIDKYLSKAREMSKGLSEEDIFIEPLSSMEFAGVNDGDKDSVEIIYDKLKENWLSGNIVISGKDGETCYDPKSTIDTRYSFCDINDDGIDDFLLVSDIDGVTKIDVFEPFNLTKCNIDGGKIHPNKTGNYYYESDNIIISFYETSNNINYKYTIYSITQYDKNGITEFTFRSGEDSSSGKSYNVNINRKDISISKNEYDSLKAEADGLIARHKEFNTKAFDPSMIIVRNNTNEDVSDKGTKKDKNKAQNSEGRTANSSFFDNLVQIGDMVFDTSGTMSVEDVKKILDSSSYDIGYEITYKDDFRYPDEPGIVPEFRVYTKHNGYSKGTLIYLSFDRLITPKGKEYRLVDACDNLDMIKSGIIKSSVYYGPISETGILNGEKITKDKMTKYLKDMDAVELKNDNNSMENTIGRNKYVAKYHPRLSFVNVESNIGGDDTTIIIIMDASLFDKVPEEEWSYDYSNELEKLNPNSYYGKKEMEIPSEDWGYYYIPYYTIKWKPDGTFRKIQYRKIRTFGLRNEFDTSYAKEDSGDEDLMADIDKDGKISLIEKYLSFDNRLYSLSYCRDVDSFTRHLSSKEYAGVERKYGCDIDKVYRKLEEDWHNGKVAIRDVSGYVTNNPASRSDQIEATFATYDIDRIGSDYPGEEFLILTNEKGIPQIDIFETNYLRISTNGDDIIYPNETCNYIIEYKDYKYLIGKDCIDNNTYYSVICFRESDGGNDTRFDFKEIVDSDKETKKKQFVVIDGEELPISEEDYNGLKMEVEELIPQSKTFDGL